MKRSPLKLAAAAACAVALALPLAACGGDDDKKTSSPDPTSTLDPVTAAYAVQVEPICAATQADLEAISSSFTGEPTEEQFASSLERASELVMEEIASIRAITAPPELAEQVDAWLAALEKAAKKMPTVSKADTEKGIDLFATSDPLADGLGLGACTSNGE